jgi:hypothetical protein
VIRDFENLILSSLLAVLLGSFDYVSENAKQKLTGII